MDEVGDGKAWTVPMGPPVVSVSIADCNDPSKFEQIYSTLKCWLYLDRQNVIHQLLNVPSWERYEAWEPNSVPVECNYKFRRFGSPRPGMNIESILRAINPMIQALIFNMKLQGSSGLSELAGVAGLLDAHGLLSQEARDALSP